MTVTGGIFLGGKLCESVRICLEMFIEANDFSKFSCKIVKRVRHVFWRRFRRSFICV